MGTGPKGFGFVNISLCLIFYKSKLDVRLIKLSKEREKVDNFLSPLEGQKISDFFLPTNFP